MLSLLQDVMNKLLEGLDPFSQYGCMIFLSVGGICQWRCNMRNMKGFIITWFDWAVWRHPRRCSNILVLFYNLVDHLLLEKRVLGQGYSGLSFLLFWCSVLWAQPPMTVSSDIHRCCAKGFCGSRTTSKCPSSSYCYPYFIVSWTGCLEVECSVS